MPGTYLRAAIPCTELSIILKMMKHKFIYIRVNLRGTEGRNCDREIKFKSRIIQIA